jgi:hypothetical protein
MGSEVGRESEYPVHLKTVVCPLNGFNLSQRQRRKFSIEVREPSWRGVGRGKIIKLRRTLSLAARERDSPVLANSHINPKQPGGIDRAQVKAQRGSLQWLDPQRTARGVVAACEQSLSVWHPD